jgi:hypothetical protein
VKPVCNETNNAFHCSQVLVSVCIVCITIYLVILTNMIQKHCKLHGEMSHFHPQSHWVCIFRWKRWHTSFEFLLSHLFETSESLSSKFFSGTSFVYAWSIFLEIRLPTACNFKSPPQILINFCVSFFFFFVFFSTDIHTVSLVLLMLKLCFSLFKNQFCFVQVLLFYFGMQCRMFVLDTFPDDLVLLHPFLVFSINNYTTLSQCYSKKDKHNHEYRQLSTKKTKNPNTYHMMKASVASLVPTTLP